MTQPPMEFSQEGQGPMSQAPMPPPVMPPPVMPPPVMQPPAIQSPAAQPAQFAPPWGQTPVDQGPVDQPPEEPMWMRAPQGRLGSTLVGNEAVAGASGTQTWDDASGQGGARWWWGIAAAVAVAVAIAALDAGLGVLSGRMLRWYFALLIGWVIGATLRAVGRVSGIRAGLVGAVITLFSWALSAVIVQAGLTAKLFGIPFFPVFWDFMAHPIEIIDAHLKVNEDQYLFILLTVAGGFIGAFAAGRKKKKL